MPCSLIEKIASASAKIGESITFIILFSPRAFFNRSLFIASIFLLSTKLYEFAYRVQEAWAMIFPPMGWRGSFANIPESGFAVIWFEITTATRRRRSSYSSIEPRVQLPAHRKRNFRFKNVAEVIQRRLVSSKSSIASSQVWVWIMLKSCCD